MTTYTYPIAMLVSLVALETIPGAQPETWHEWARQQGPLAVILLAIWWWYGDKLKKLAESKEDDKTILVGIVQNHTAASSAASAALQAVAAALTAVERTLSEVATTNKLLIQRLDDADPQCPITGVLRSEVASNRDAAAAKVRGRL